MSENINTSGGVTRKMINMNISEDVSYWISKWNITREQLQNAVDRVGGRLRRDSASSAGAAAGRTSQ